MLDLTSPTVEVDSFEAAPDVLADMVDPDAEPGAPKLVQTPAAAVEAKRKK
jgi:hypothetical protein